MKDDTDPEKWAMKGQTEIKHEILKNYLVPWLNKISETSSVVQYIDGFAGRGRYSDGSEGSPLIAMNVASDRAESLSKKLQEIQCTFVEARKANFENLKDEVKEKKDETSDSVKVDPRFQTFEEFAKEFVNGDGGSKPAFIFIDPFGFSGLPFDIVNDLINLRPTGIELFITFMSGKMAQYMENPSHQVAISNMLGTEQWKSQIESNLSKEERAERFMVMYEERLREVAGVNYVWPFQMSEEGKRQTSYYLIHATNHFDGFKLMKGIMYRAGAKEQFAYLGPDHYPYLSEQQSFSDFTKEQSEDERVKRLANFLRDRYAGEPKRRLIEIMKETYEETLLIETHYRKAGKWLRGQRLAKIHHFPNRPHGTDVGSGFGKDDEIEIFSSNLSNFTD